MTVENIYTPIVTAFNTQLCENYGFENLYDVVESGKWTIDKFGELKEEWSRNCSWQFRESGEWSAAERQRVVSAFGGELR